MNVVSRIFLLIALLTVPLQIIRGQEPASESTEQNTENGIKLRIQIDGNDTVFLATIREINVYPPLKFKNKREERFYWKTVRDVKRTLPYAKIVSSELIKTNKHLVILPDDKTRKDYLEQYEKDLFKQYEADLRKMSFSQGKMLIKLIDRECDKTSYDLIRIYRGGFSAFFWQGVAKIFGADLKAGYSTNRDEDRIVERIVTQVEAGQL